VRVSAQRQYNGAEKIRKTARNRMLLIGADSGADAQSGIAPRAAPDRETGFGAIK